MPIDCGKAVYGGWNELAESQYGCGSRDEYNLDSVTVPET